MADNTERIWSINDLMKRYGINRASMTEYAKSKMDLINSDGIHAKKMGREWQFDDTARKMLDELRGYGIAPQNYSSPEEAEIEQLRNELLQAEKFMNIAQEQDRRRLEEISALKSEIINHLKAGEESRALLNAAKGDLVVAQKEMELEKHKAEQEKEKHLNRIQSLEDENNRERREKEELKREVDEMKAKYEAEKNKKWWQKFWE